MLKHNKTIACCLSLMIMCGVAGCDTESGMYATPSDLITVALPYVEAVHLPAAIHAGQPFSVTIDLSCAINPLALRSPERPFSQVDHANGAKSVTVKPFRDLTQASSSLPVHSSVVYDFGPLPVGGCTFYYLTAATREQGGMNVLYDRRSGVEMNFDAITYYKTLEFTVLP